MTFFVEMKNIKAFDNYLNIIATSWIVVLMLRVVECAVMLFTFGNENGMLASEMLGLAADITCVNALLLLLFPLYSMISKCSARLADTLYMVMILILTTSHLVVIQYFFNQHKPLGSLLFGYSLDEIILTATTADVSIFKVAALIASILILSLLAYFIVKNKNVKVIKIISLVLFPITIPLIFVIHDGLNDFAVNKSYVFYKAAIESQIEEKQYCHELSCSEIIDYQRLYPNRKFVSHDYPLLHKFETTDSLGYYFDDFESSPNVVILFVEGLNDDFVHDFRGANLMPNLRNLIDNGLYWEKCFTLGERSFAVVPSVLGSLPYGEMGFTLLDRLPRHLTLISVLNANGYQTDFFYGQGSWFHKKNAFFKKNNIDLIFDNAKYSGKYEKILVGKDNYFWGYDDKSLFRQSLEVIDTLGYTPRLDVYFTGSTHSPFIITETDKYNERLEKISENLQKNTDKKYFKHYGKYIRTVLYLDDALGEFFDEYSKRADYQNTIFIITGDHPMSELSPVNSLKRYHVPFVIYSPQLKHAARFSNVVSHLDFYETMMAFMENYGVKRPELSASFGGNMFDDNNNIAFMDEPRNVIDFYSDGYFISGNDLYNVDDNFNIEKNNDDDIYNLLKHRLEIVRKTSEFTSLENRIMPVDVYCNALNDTLLQSVKDETGVSLNKMYYNIMSDVDVTSYNTLTFDLSLDYQGVDRSCMLVYTLKDENGKNYVTEYNGFGGAANKFSIHKQIQVDKSKGKTLFGAFIYNPDGKEYSFSSLDGILLGNIE